LVDGFDVKQLKQGGFACARKGDMMVVEIRTIEVMGRMCMVTTGFDLGAWTMLNNDETQLGF
jgi:hypothetical protein